MITAVDTSVLIDVFRDDPKYGKMSAEALGECIRTGSIVFCDIVLAELVAIFPSTNAFERAIKKLPITFLPIERDVAILAGELWRQYRLQGGNRTRIISDFLIAAHAQLQCDRLLTRDRGFCRSYFRKLQVIDPST